MGGHDPFQRGCDLFARETDIRELPVGEPAEIRRGPPAKEQSLEALQRHRGRGGRGKRRAGKRGAGRREAGTELDDVGHEVVFQIRRGTVTYAFVMVMESAPYKREFLDLFSKVI